MARFKRYRVPQEYVASADWQGGNIEITGTRTMGWGINQRVGQYLFPLGWHQVYTDAMREASVHYRARKCDLLLIQAAPYPVDACRTPDQR